MVCYIIFWIFTSEPIDFDIKYPYMYRFVIVRGDLNDRYSNNATCIALNIQGTYYQR